MQYFRELNNIINKVEVNCHKGKNILLEKAITDIVNSIINCSKKGNKVILTGNGGSASIASHTATDLLKNAKIPALAFSDSSLLTCLSNDLGYENVFKKPIEMLAKKGDIVFAISSSGSSKNILNAANMAKDKNCFLATLSGFKKYNPLQKLGDINFYVPSQSYGYVELTHSIICHCITDRLVEKMKGGH
ncbi:MAG: SIS domain-containing protein [Candidatus Omnitrophica bacterium]|jgi:D-sedoheptulose 7-phosphate isomerase|nr:SIS domain-containing protein [Candidatus Omnitrophota bacterium]